MVQYLHFRILKFPLTEGVSREMFFSPQNWHWNKGVSWAMAFIGHILVDPSSISRYPMITSHYLPVYQYIQVPLGKTSSSHGTSPFSICKSSNVTWAIYTIAMLENTGVYNIRSSMNPWKNPWILREKCGLSINVGNHILTIYFWANCNNSLTWILRQFWDDSSYPLVN